MKMITSLTSHSIVVILCFMKIKSLNSDEIQGNTFLVTLIDISKTTWNNEGKEPKFTDAIATVANDYCSTNYDECGLKTWNSSRSFKPSHVKISPDYPKQDHQNLQVKFHVELPKDIRKNNTNVLPESVLSNIITLKGSTLSSQVGVTVKLKENATSKPKVDNTMNFIMIPVSFGILGILIVLVVCLQYCHKRKIKDTKTTERRHFSSSQEKTGDASSQSPFVVSNAAEIPKAAVRPQRREDLSAQAYCEDETRNDYAVKPQQSDSETDKLPHKRKEKTQKDGRHEEDKLDHGDNGQVNKECLTEEYEINQKEVNEDESDQERRRKKERKRKKHSKKKRESVSGFSQEDGSDEKDVKEKPAETDAVPKRKRSEARTKQITQDQDVGNESDVERRAAKERKRKSKRHKRKIEMSHSQENESMKHNGNVPETVESDDIFSKLPPPRKLPPI